MLFNKKFRIGLTVFFIAVFIAGCGPSPEEQAATAAALTAAAATSTPSPTSTPAPTFTPTPTPTPTPVPYALSLIVVGEEDAPIIGASVVLAEIDGMQNTDDVGQVFWYDLPGETVNLSITAQGYIPTEISETIVRGENEVSVTLERDPFGLLPSEACQANEKILYIEDLQDGHANDWPDIERNNCGWEIGPNPDEPEDLVIIHTGGEECFANLENLTINNAVWRIKLQRVGRPWIGFMMRAAFEPYETEDGLVEDSRYVINLEDTAYINKMEEPIRSSFISGNPHKPKQGWQLLEISVFEGELEVWIDGYRILAYNDQDPLPEGGVWLEVKPYDDQSVFYFDDIAFCELTEPFVPMPTR